MLVLNSYDLIAEQWHAGRATFFRERPYIERMVQSLEHGAPILDLGCGTGAPIARHVVERGFRVTGVDQSRAMLKIAQRVVPAAAWVQADIRTVQFVAHFAAVVAWDSIFHIDRRDHASIFGNVYQWLRPGGRFLVSVGGSSDPGFTSEMFGQPFFYSGFAPEEARQLLETHGFHILLQEVDDPSSRGRVAILAQKPV